jgi:hypothetical protein
MVYSLAGMLLRNKKEWIIDNATTWIILKYTVVKEALHKRTYCMIPVIWNSEVGKTDLQLGGNLSIPGALRKVEVGGTWGLSRGDSMVYIW